MSSGQLERLNNSELHATVCCASRKSPKQSSAPSSRTPCVLPSPPRSTLANHCLGAPLDVRLTFRHWRPEHSKFPWRNCREYRFPPSLFRPPTELEKITELSPAVESEDFTYFYLRDSCARQRRV